MESVIRDKTVEHLEKNKIIKDSQPGFKNKRSCPIILLDLFSDEYRMYGNTRVVDVAYLDSQKPFHKVPHKRLISTIETRGITGNLGKWIEDWLSDQTH